MTALQTYSPARTAAPHQYPSPQFSPQAPVPSGHFAWPLEARTGYLREVWRRIGLRAGGRPIAIFGGGKHTRFLVEHIVSAGGLSIAAVIDDFAAPGATLAGVPVLRPEAADPRRFALVVVSSDSIEAKLAERARMWVGGAGGGSLIGGAAHAQPEVIRLYEGLPPGPYERPSPFRGVYGSVVDQTNEHLPIDPGSRVLRLPRKPVYDLKRIKSGHDMPLPPSDLRVGYFPNDDAAYLRVSEEDVNNIKQMVIDHGGQAGLRSIRRVLDWGCSSGRLLRHWTDLALDGGEAWGCDICAHSINWAGEHLSPPLKFFNSTLRPPLPLPDASFDLVYANSVFTHVRELWDAWLMEMRRIIRPGGYLWASVHEEASWALCARSPHGALTVRCADVDFSKPFTDDFVSVGTGFDPVTFWHSEGIKRRWSFAFDVLEVRPGVIRQQAGVLLQRPLDTPARGGAKTKAAAATRRRRAAAGG